MPSFDSRGVEIRNTLTTIQPELDGGEFVRMTAVVADYVNARDAALTMMQVFLSDDHIDPIAGEYASKLRDMSRTATDKLDNMLSGISNPSQAAVRFREQLSFAEFIFWGQISTLKLAEARDSMVFDCQKVRDLISALDKKWQSLSEEDLRIEEAEQRAAQDVKDLLEQSLAQAMPYWVQASAAVVELRAAWKSIFSGITEHVKEALIGAGAPRALVEGLLTIASWANSAANIAELAKKLGMSVDEVMSWINRIRSMNIGGLVQYRIGTVVDSKTKTVTSYLDYACKGLKPLVEGQYNSRMTAFKSYLDNEGVVIVAYGGIRSQVDQFLKECNLDGLRSTHAKALAMMDGLDSSLNTDGQKSDWSALRRSLKDAFDARRAATEKAFEDFYRANDGRFLGGLSTDTERTLLEPDKWLATTNGIIAVGLDDKLREWRQNVTVVQAGPKDAFDEIQNSFAGLPLDIRDSFKSSINEYLTQQITTLNGEADKAIGTLEKCQIMVNTRKISDDMDRSRLQQALRATIR